jgi:hypothetical protein
MFEVPAETVRLVMFPPVRFRVAAVVVAPTTPPEILARIFHEKMFNNLLN